MDWNAVALGLAAAVDARVRNLNALDYVPDSIPTPCFMVAEMDIEFDKTMGRGTDQATVTCRVMTERSDDEAGQTLLRSYSRGEGVSSVKQAIEYDRTLGGACDDLRVTSVKGNRLFIVGEARYYGSEFEVFIIGSGRG